MTENEIGDQIIAAAMKVHTALGPGLLENAYGLCMAYELEKRCVQVHREIKVAIRYDDLVIEDGYRLDLLVGGKVIVELKAQDVILPKHRGQLLGYLKLGGFKLGYLLNFNVVHMRDGISRLVNKL
jgi:GxxExxY protein